MANFTSINVDDYRQTKEGAAARGPEHEPQRSSGVGVTSPQEHISLDQSHLDPAVTAAGVTVVQDTIHPSQVEGTEAEAHPGTGPFQTQIPLEDRHADHPRRGLSLKIGEAFSWLNVFKRASTRRQKEREKLGLTD